MMLLTGQNIAGPSEKTGNLGRASGSTKQFISRDGEEPNGVNTTEKKSTDDQSTKLNPLETRAVAWDEAERAKYMARLLLYQFLIFLLIHVSNISSL